MTKFWRRLALLLCAGALMFFSSCIVSRPYVYRTPRVVIDTVRMGRCVGRQWKYFCRRPDGHMFFRKIRCRTRYGVRVKRKRWFKFDRRCRNHAFINEAPRRRADPEDDRP